MFSSIFEPFQRIFASSRAQANPASVKLEQASDALETTNRKGEFINHLHVPPARKEVPLSELLQVNKRKLATEDFEVVPRTKGVVVLEDFEEVAADEVISEDWPRLVGEDKGSLKVTPGRESYAQVAKASAGLHQTVQ